MNLNAKRGDKVRFSCHGGTTVDRNWACRHLKLGAVYTVAQVDISDFSAGVRLLEFPQAWFNTVLFDDIESPTKGENDVEEPTITIWTWDDAKSEEVEEEIGLDAARDRATDGVCEVEQVMDGLCKKVKSLSGELEAAKHAESVAWNEVVIRQKELVETHKQLAANRYGVANEVYDLRTQLATARQDLKQQIHDLNVGNKRLHDELETEKTRASEFEKAHQYGMRAGDEYRRKIDSLNRKADAVVARLEKQINDLHDTLRAEKAVDLPAEAKAMLVRVAYQAGEISIGRAAELLGRSVQDVQELGRAQGPGLDALLGLYRRRVTEFWDC
jgi:predicted HTH domain antitoxin